ncbi:MAG: ammonia-forming cytochrome c nitrite reductase subunit c552 [Bacillota bacterium]|nr:ammonia-forming cytochrome c nitrite reductase subunit c552 [Bacillota bacterium]MDW7684870.1 ammonia-forming cytochrome c nitrite reductase subunit c552 [Bacillota bacterium]
MFRKRKRKLNLLYAIVLGVVMLTAGCTDPVTNDPEPVEPVVFTGFSSLREAADSDNWREFFPNQYEYWQATEEMRETTYGGGGRAEAESVDVEKINYLEMYPFLKTTYAGFAFEKGYYRSRGHVYALTDVTDTERLPDWEARPGSCLACKSTDVVVLIDEYGDDWYSMPFAEVLGEHTIGCLDCHDHETAELKIQRDYLNEALAHNTFKNIDPQGRADLTCAQCHVNYHFDAETKKITYPWSFGLTVEDQLAHYNAERRSDEWEHAITGALVAKIQHPEYDLYHEGQITNVHSTLGLGCNDCHMPKIEDAHGKQFSSHTWTSPLTHVEETCLGCHNDWGEAGVIEKAELKQAGVYEKQNMLGNELAEFILALGEAKDSGALTDEELEKAREIHREAQFYWDFIWVENSNGFHNWDEAHRVLDQAEELINEGMEMLQ